jgi:hypothetical protein
MKCHGENKGNKGKHKHNPMKHMLHMLLCCGLPMIIVALLPLITKLSPGTAGFIGKVIPFLCPIMMVGMMFSMVGGSKEKSCCDIPKQDSNTEEIV